MPTDDCDFDDDSEVDLKSPCVATTELAAECCEDFAHHEWAAEVELTPTLAEYQLPWTSFEVQDAEEEEDPGLPGGVGVADPEELLLEKSC